MNDPIDNFHARVRVENAAIRDLGPRLESILPPGHELEFLGSGLIDVRAPNGRIVSIVATHEDPETGRATDELRFDVSIIGPDGVEVDPAHSVLSVVGDEAVAGALLRQLRSVTDSDV